jgi:MFS family permease
MAVATVERFRTTTLTGKAALTAVSTLLALAFMSSTLVTPLYVIYEKAFQFSPLTLTLVYATYVVGNLAALLLFGRLSDVIGRRRVALAALAAAIASTLLFLFATNTAWLFAGRALSGFAVGLTAGTATAWIAELDGDKMRASLISTSTNFLGLTVGALLAGTLAQYAPWPLHLSFLIYLALLAVTALLIARTRETVEHTIHDPREISLRPRLGVPKKIRVRFIAPAVTAFNAMALVGFYAALIPSVLAESLHQSNRAVAGATVAELTVIVSLAILATHRLRSRTAMLCGLALLLPSVALLVLAQATGSMPLLLVGTAIGGVSAALGYRGSLQVINEIAPANQRAEVVSAYFVTGFVGNALPVIGVGVIETVATPLIASMSFALVISLFTLAGLFTGVKYAEAR